MRRDNYRLYAFVSYLLSLVTPVFWGVSESLGAYVFYYGLIGLFFEGYLLLILPLLANITFFINVLLNKKYIKISLVLSVITIVFGLFTLGLPILHVERNSDELFLGIGFFFWVLSFVLLMIGQIKILKTSKTKKILEV